MIGLERLDIHVDRNRGGPENAAHHSGIRIGPESAIEQSEPIPNRAVRLMQSKERRQAYQPSPQE
jgi:hypothetical protein